MAANNALLLYAAVGLVIGVVTWLLLEGGTLMPRRERWGWTIGVGLFWLPALIGVALYAVARVIMEITAPLVRRRAL